MNEVTHKPFVRSVVLEPDLERLASARRFVAQAAVAAGFSQERVFDITVACSEATANAMEHVPVKGEVTLRTLLYRDRLEIQVLGPGEFQAPHRLDDQRSHRGLGLPLMAQFSDHLALYSGPSGGTLVSLTFYRPGAEPAPAEELMPPSMQELVEENELVSAITSNAPVGLFVLDPDLRFKWVNHAYRAVLSEPFRSRDLVGDYIGDVLTGIEESGALDELREASRTGEPSGPVERVLPGADGGVTWWRSAVPLTGGRPEPPYDLLVMVTDETDRVRAEQALQESERELRTIVDNSRDGINMLDLATCRYVFMSPAQVRLTGFTQEEINNISAEEACDRVHPEDRELSVEQQRMVIAGEEPTEPVMYRWKVKSGEYRWFSDQRKLVRDEDGRPVALVGISRDITEQKQIERRQAFLLQLSDALRPLGDPGEVQAAATQAALKYFEADQCHYAEPGGTCTPVAIFKAALDEGRPLLVSDARTSDLLDDDQRRLCLQSHMVSFMGVPVIRDGRSEGMLCLAQSAPREWTDFEVQTAAEVAERASAAIRRAAAERALFVGEERYAEVTKSLEESFCVIEVIFDDQGRPVDWRYVETNPGFVKQGGWPDAVGKRVTELLPDIEQEWLDFYGTIASSGIPGRLEDQVNQLGSWYDIYAFKVGGAEATTVGVLAYNATGRRQAEAAFHAGERYRELFSSIDQGFLVVDVIEDDERQIVDLRCSEANAASERIFGRPLTGMLLSAVGQERVRFLRDAAADLMRTGESANLRRKQIADRWYDLQMFRLSGAGGRQVGVIFTDVTDEVRREADLTFTTEVDRFLSGNVAAQEIFLQVGQMLGDHLGVDNFVFAEAHEETDRARALYAWRDERGVRLLDTYRLSELNGPDYWHAMHSGVPFVVSDTASDPRTDGVAHLKFGVAAFVVVPFDRVGSWKYLVSVDSATPRAWTGREVELVKEVANRVVVRAERAWAEEELRAREESYRLLAAENERLYRQQLNIAEQLQQSLLNIPSEIGRVRLGHLYRSATEAARVGGDFYDVFEAKDGNIAILMGDVAGHGIEAARTSTLVKDVVHVFTHQSLRTHEVMRRTNLLLIEKGLTEFVTLFLGILDPDSGSLRYSSAGHPESMIRRVSGEIEWLGCGTSPLGIYADASWKPHEILMAPGDLLLLYTDGVTEARRGLELFGEKRLERLLRRKRITAGRLPSLVLDQVLAFSSGSLHDDMAVLALALTEPPEGAPLRKAPAPQKLLDG